MKSITKMYLSVSELAAMSPYSAARIRRFCREGSLKSTRRPAGPGGGKNTMFLIRPEDFKSFMESRSGGGV
ncbi:helix-turn-helix domain-containing protein [Corynebacterium mustelae]|nr:helix-turn-helix domain-containing protein [Corynebacterium mustelae]